MTTAQTETLAEQLDRVRLMAADDATWDLSDNDRAALSALLVLVAERQAAQDELAGVYRKLAMPEDQREYGYLLAEIARLQHLEMEVSALRAGAAHAAALEVELASERERSDHRYSVLTSTRAERDELITENTWLRRVEDAAEAVFQHRHLLYDDPNSIHRKLSILGRVLKEKHAPEFKRALSLAPPPPERETK